MKLRNGVACWDTFSGGDIGSLRVDKAEERARLGGVFLHLRDLREAMRCGNALTGHLKKRN